MRRLGLHLLGAFAASLDGKPLTGIKTDKARALLIYLAVERSRAHRRQALAGMLWPDYPEEGARANLRHALANLRQVLGEEKNETPFLMVEGETLQLNPECDCWLDVAEFERLAAGTANSDLESATALYRGGFMEGFSLKDSPDFDNWTAILRERYLQLVSKALGKLGDQAAQDGEYEQAIAYARRRLALEPWQEAAHQQLMRSLALSGQRAAALAQYEACCKLLKEELGVEPSVETKRLQASIRDGEITGSQQEKARKHNLPAQVTSFIGREQAIEQVKGVLSSHRLLTLTGSGGTGKTRLSLQIAAELVEQYPDGVWLVELAPLADSELVVQTTARTLGMRLEASAQALTLLEDYLEDKHLLLILDNCEHLVEACARLADALLKACPHLRILASSREALGIEGEAPYRVPPLAFPRADEPVENLGQYEAVRLFLERAGTASPDLQLTPENASAVAKICQQLDGIPLAIELAAARVKVLRVEEIAQRLDDRLRLLMGGSRAALQRYQTLRASIDWSYDLLSPAEQRLLRRLSVFAGGWMLEAAEYVGCGEGIETCEVLDLLSQLVNKSLVVVEAGGTETRYRMLETIRQYAQEKLAEMGEEEKIRDRHLVYYVELAERVEGKIRGPDMVVILNRLEADLDNIRLGLAWSLDRNHQELGLRITSALLHFWHLCGHHIDAWDWFSRLRFLESEECAFKFTSSVSTLVQARALYVISLLAFHLGKSNLAIEMAKKSLILFQDFGVDGKQGYAYALTSIASTYTYFRDEETARTQLERSLAIFNKIGDKFGASECLHVLGENADIRRQFEQAKSYFNETLRISMQIGDKVNTVYALFLLGILAFHMGDPKKSRFYFEESLQIHPDINKFSGFSTPCYLAQLDWMEGNYSKAIQLINETLLIGYRQQNVISISFCLVLLGNIELSQGHYDKAIQWYDEKRNHDQKYDLPGEMAQNWYIFGKLAWAKGDEKSAEKYFSEALMLSHEIGDKFLDGVSLLYLGKVKIAQGEYDQSRVDLINSLLHQKENQEPHVIMYCIEAIAFLMAVDQLVEQSVRLLGATDDWCDLTKLWRTPRERQERESTIAFLGKALGEEAFAKAWEEGKTMTLEQAIAYAKEVGNG